MVDIAIHLGLLLAAIALLIVAGVGVPISIGLALAITAKRRLRRRARGRLCLTYDDGPSDRVERRLLDVLLAYEARATFFLLGENATTMPQRVEAIRDAGHELACHGGRHVPAWSWAPWRAVQDIALGYDMGDRWLASDAPYRPPHGRMTLWSWIALRRRGAPVVLWTHDSGDTKGDGMPRVRDVVQRIIDDRGGVVLLHSFDGEGHLASRRRAEYTLALTAALLDAARVNNLRICTIGELIEDGHPAESQTRRAA